MERVVEIKVGTRASANTILGERDGVLQVRVTAAPVDGDANKAIIKLLAKHFGVPPSAITIIRGQTSRHKTVKITT